MYEFHYNYFKHKYPGDASKLLFIDTDSLMYSVKANKIYKDIYEDKHLFNFSGYENESPYHSNENKKVTSKMKDELGGKVITELLV